ncbi:MULTISPECIES: enoyl-[acyl-carrier-protein] reductase FabK [Carnobacterium]|uniref:Probable nitronate monooxygenase n=1 Tax=Carnobacterium inhibens subsp. gilichinskyi TaxID=1266845 RepID=U5S983_9LACT|nr:MULTISPECIES: enoyl-[acyl-carrier-protein] reductase FabK [Carnobacterium]AGY81800.1 2-nitropropane dioxygenase [Carnobacterium inhibens subsp. gilichinskyi]MDN5372509.1 enoyl-[acyl-carrier protein] reductase [Carnobacterium sp.]
MQSELVEKLGIKYPIIQGAMSWVANPSLVSAVSNAGGLGILACGFATSETVRELIKETKSQTDKPFGINVLLTSPHADDVVKVVCEEKVKVVTTGAGSPGRYMSQFKNVGTVVIPVVASVALARRMENEGADAIICEGMEAGGHIGKTTTMNLVPQVVDAVSVPVIAAGGIADGRGVAAAFMLGASAVQLGTRFVVAHESTVHQNFKDAILKAKDIDTVVTGQITGHPVRVLRNKLTRQYLKIEKDITSDEKPDFNRLEELGTGALRRAVIDGDKETGSFMSGQSAGLVNKEQSSHEIIQELMHEYQEVIKEQANLILK